MTPIAPRAKDRVLSTMEADGRRRWLTPRLAHGRLLSRRRAVAYGLILFLAVLPLLPINGKPAVLLDVPGRQFTLFGYTFLPTDTVLLACWAISWFATIFFTTALAGRVWCGWTCPQTVYMEFVYRPIERLCLGRSGVGGRPREGLSPMRKAIMHVLFVLVSLAITHTLLSYFVGAEQLRRWITSSPLQHPWAFGVIVLSTLGVWYNFVFFREQMCIVACPYGRMQSVLFDRHSVGVRYHEPRGEPRTKMGPKGAGLDERKGVSLPLAPSAQTLDPSRPGDCIDCSMCVQVCPTGIDIRNGVQMECVACTQCIDACNTVMRKVGLPEGLIGYYSQAELEGEPRKLLRARIVLYGLISVGFLAVMSVLILTKKPFDASLVRSMGLPFFVTPHGKVENTMRLTVRNRTSRDATFTLSSRTPGIELATIDTTIAVPAGGSVTRPVPVIADPAVVRGTTSAKLAVRDEHAEQVLSYEFFAPTGAP